MGRVAVTGIGAVTALGPDVAALDRGLRAGASGIREVTLFDASGFRTRLGGQAPDPFVDPRTPRASRPDRFGLQAALEAARHAGLDPDAGSAGGHAHAPARDRDEDRDRDGRSPEAASPFADAACVFGTGTGGAADTERFLAATLAGTVPPPDLALLLGHQPASVTDLVCRRLGIGGPRLTIMTACSSSATAIGYAGDLIRLGRVDVAVAGGAEGLCRLTYAGFNALRAVSPDVCRPFDADRKGISLGEGAAVLVLESEERARARGAEVLCWLAGHGISADAHHMTAPHPEGDGAARAMQAALDDARLAADAIGWVNAHGTGTPHNDAAETAAIRRVFGPGVARLPVSSVKSMLGHTLGAAGAIEAVASVLALRGDYLPPTATLERVDPALALDFIPRHARAARVDAVLSSSFAFGGNNTALVFTRA